LTSDELGFLKRDNIFKPSYLEFMRGFQLNREFINVWVEDGELKIKIKGPIIFATQFEIYVLSIVHEIYSRHEHKDIDLQIGRDKLREKIDKVKKYIVPYKRPIHIIDFGTRRAFTSEWQEEVLFHGIRDYFISGTSNMLFGMLYNIPTVGTHAHEFIQAYQGLGVCSVENSQRVAFDVWLKEYRGKLGIALSDTLGIKKFLKDFDVHFANAFNGVRHDSGDAYLFTDEIIGHYRKFGIDSRTKKIVFSDGLDIDTVLGLANYCEGRILCDFGVGTSLMNDVGVKSLQMVIKLVSINGNPVAKISDNPAKTMCKDEVYLNYLKEIIKR
jgi:nicotinate phosphoribosyltransferase